MTPQQTIEVGESLTTARILAAEEVLEELCDLLSYDEATKDDVLMKTLLTSARAQLLQIVYRVRRGEGGEAFDQIKE